MGEHQKIVLLVAAAVFFLMLACPPFVVRLPNRSFVDKGYTFIFTPPQHGYLSATISAITLVAQIAGVTLLAGLTMGVGFVMCSFTKPKHCLHYIASDCLVVRDHATEKEIQAIVAATA